MKLSYVTQNVLHVTGLPCKISKKVAEIALRFPLSESEQRYDILNLKLESLATSLVCVIAHDSFGLSEI